MSAKHTTRTADPDFETRRVELESHNGPALAVANLAPRVHPQDRGAAAQSMASEAILLRLPMVMRKTGLARSTIYKLVSANRFPAPIKLTTRSVAWLQGEIDSWVASCARARRAAH